MTDTPELETLLRHLEEKGQSHDAAQTEHRNKRLNLEPWVPRVPMLGPGRELTFTTKLQ